MNPQETLKILGDLANQKSAATITFVDRIITLSTSALAFSMTFRTSLVGVTPSHLWLLKLAWIGFAICSVFGVITHLAAVSAVKRAIKALKENDQIGTWASAHPIYGLIYRFLVLVFPVSIAALMAFGVINTR